MGTQRGDFSLEREESTVLFAKKTAAAVLAALMVVNGAAVMASATDTEQNEENTTGQVQQRSVTFEAVDEIVYTVDAVNVRSGPGLEYDVIATLKYGSAIRRTGIGSNGWSRVSYMGEDAYMYSPLLTTKNPNGENTEPVTEADTARLVRQIAIANGLKAENFTGDSWAALQEALEAARWIKDNGTQEEVDHAAETLEKAIAALVMVDYASLDRVLADTAEGVHDSALYDVASRLQAALAEAQALRESGDQAAVDACAEKIAALLTELQELEKKLEDPEVVIKEVEVEVPPSGDFCNMGVHRTWPVAFFISLAINALLAVVIALILKKKRYKAEDVPLVDYDIDDDM